MENFHLILQGNVLLLENIEGGGGVQLVSMVAWCWCPLLTLKSMKQTIMYCPSLWMFQFCKLKKIMMISHLKTISRILSQIQLSLLGQWMWETIWRLLFQNRVNKLSQLCYFFFLIAYLMFSRSLYGDQAKFFEAETKPRLKHKSRGTVSMANNGDNLHGSQVSWSALGASDRPSWVVLDRGVSQLNVKSDTQWTIKS